MKDKEASAYAHVGNYIFSSWKDWGIYEFIHVRPDHGYEIIQKRCLKHELNSNNRIKLLALSNVVLLLGHA
jgi:hypothetical protein